MPKRDHNHSYHDDESAEEQFVFHVTPSRNVESILSEGLVPQSGKKLGRTYGPAVYFVHSAIDAWNIAYQLKRSTKVLEDYTILAVDRSCIEDAKPDPESVREAGILSCHIVAPECIRVYETIPAASLRSDTFLKSKNKRHYGANPPVPGIQIDAHDVGLDSEGRRVLHLAWFQIPKELRGKGLGKKTYLEWESSLPKEFSLIELHAADAGAGPSGEFWEKLGFQWKYTGPAEVMEELPWEMQKAMHKGIHGEPTPGPTYLEEPLEESDECGANPPVRLIAYHGTSSARMPDVRKRGLRDPFLAINPDIAQYYAIQASEADESEPVVLKIAITDTSKLRYDGWAMNEPVMADKAKRDAAWNRAAKEHPEWTRDGGKYVTIPKEAWEYSWESVGSVWHEGTVTVGRTGDA